MTERKKFSDLAARTMSRQARARAVGRTAAMLAEMPLQELRRARDLSLKVGVELPICQQVYKITWEGSSAKAAVAELMGRSAKSELV